MAGWNTWPPASVQQRHKQKKRISKLCNAFDLLESYLLESPRVFTKCMMTNGFVMVAKDYKYQANSPRTNFIISSCVGLLMAISLSGCDKLSIFGDNYAAPADLPSISASVMARGLDADANGIRDEIDQMLASMFTSVSERKPWLSYAAALQRGAELHALSTQADVENIQMAVLTTKACVLDGPINADLKALAMDNLWVLTFDTSLRRSGWAFAEATLPATLSQFDDRCESNV